MKALEYKKLNETLYIEKLDNGLEVYMLEKNAFNKTFALFATAYGSVNSEFVPIGKKEFEKVPDGIAHFLEHKLFDQENGEDVFEKFSEQGASANAYTSYSRTAYLFSCTERTEENLSLLLDYVQAPYFTEESVEKEKGIIEQELKMYLDMPGEVLMLGVLENLYHNNPVKIDIGGTVESVYEINKDMLDLCYNTFYHPSNMKLVIVGKFDKDEIIELIKNNQAQKEFPKLDKVIKAEVEEPNDVALKSSEIDFNVTTPMTAIAIKAKDPYIDNTEKIKRQISLSILFDGLFAKSSDNYLKLVKAGIINDSFSYSYMEEPSFGFALISCDTNKYKDFIESIKDILLTSKITEETFMRIKKLKIGEYMNQFDSIDYIGRQLVNHLTNEYIMLDFLEEINNLTKADFDAIVEEFVTENCISDCTVLKK